MNARVSRIVGGGFWVLALLGVGGWVLSAAGNAGVKNPILNAWLPGGPKVMLIDPTRRLGVGDSAFMQRPDGGWQQIGDVVEVRRESDSSNQIQLRTYAINANAVDASGWVVHQSSGRMDDIVATLIPRPKRERLVQEITQAMSQHGDEIMEAMMPIMMQSLTASLPVIESEFRASIQRHEIEIRELLTRHQKQIIEERIVPLARQEILPTLERHAAEPAETIGREIWARASLWRFGWRAVYDQSPLPKRDMVQEEWRRFVDDEVVPIIENHVDEIVVAIQRTLMDLASNPELRSELGDVLADLANDAPTRELVGRIVTESVLENEALRDVWADTWTSPSAKAALDVAGRRIEPLLRQIADEVLGTREAGIEPGFARVLRNQILGKDRCWITVTPVASSTSPPRTSDAAAGGDSAVTLNVARQYSVYPVVHLATASRD